MHWRTLLALAVALAGAGVTLAPTASATHACDAEPLVWTPAFTVGMFTGSCDGAFVVVHHDGCMMVEWGVHEGPVGVGGASTCAVGVWTSHADAPRVPVLP